MTLISEIAIIKIEINIVTKQKSGFFKNKKAQLFKAENINFLFCGAFLYSVL